MAVFNFLDRESVSDISPLTMISLPYRWWPWAHDECAWCTMYVINSSWSISAPRAILHALTIIMVPLATPEQSSLACQFWFYTRFSPKWIGSITSFKHVIWANTRLSLQQEALFVCHKQHGANTQACFQAKGRLHFILLNNVVQTTKKSSLISCTEGSSAVIQQTWYVAEASG